NRTTKDLVFENKTTAARQRLKHTLAIAKLSTTAGLFLVSALDLCALRDRLFGGKFGRMKCHVHTVPLLQLFDDGLDVQLSRARKQELLRLCIATEVKRLIFF